MILEIDYHGTWVLHPQGVFGLYVVAVYPDRLAPLTYACRLFDLAKFMNSPDLAGSYVIHVDHDEIPADVSVMQSFLRIMKAFSDDCCRKQGLEPEKFLPDFPAWKPQNTDIIGPDTGVQMVRRRWVTRG